MNMCLLDFQVVHQLDHVLRLSRAIQLRLFALSMIAAIQSDHLMVLGQLLGDAVVYPVALGAAGVAVNQDYRRPFSAKHVVVDPDPVRGLEIGFGVS